MIFHVYLIFLPLAFCFPPKNVATVIMMVLRFMLACKSVNFWLEGCKIAKKYETLWKTATSRNEFSHEKKFSDLYRDRIAKITSINFLQLYHLRLMLSKDNFGAFLWSLNFLLLKIHQNSIIYTFFSFSKAIEKIRKSKHAWSIRNVVDYVSEVE